MKKLGFTFFFSLFSMFCFSQSMADSLEIAYKNKDPQLLDRFFKNWEANSITINNQSFSQLPEIEKDIYNIFEDLYSSSRLEVVDGMDNMFIPIHKKKSTIITTFDVNSVNIFTPLYPNVKYFVIPDVIYYNVFETLDKKELIKKHLHKNEMCDTAYESELKHRLNDTTELSIPQIYYDDMMLIHDDSLFNFRPRIYIQGTEILSMTSTQEAFIQDFFNDKDSIIHLNGFKFRKLKKDWADRKQFIDRYIEVALWNNNHWITQSNPKINKVLFDKNRGTAMLLYRIDSSGGAILYKKVNDTWKFISSDIYYQVD